MFLQLNIKPFSRENFSFLLNSYKLIFLSEIVNCFIISNICKVNIMNTLMIKSMKIFIMTISNTIINYRIYLVNEWFIKFIFFNNNIFVCFIIHLIKRTFIEIKILFNNKLRWLKWNTSLRKLSQRICLFFFIIFFKTIEQLFIFLEGYGNFVLQSQSPRWRFSTEEYNERQNYQPITID